MENIFIKTLQNTFSFVPPILIIMFFSLFISGLLVESGVIRKLEFIAKPLVRSANLPKEAGFGFLISFGSPLAGNIFLAQSYRKGLINKEEAFVSSLFCSVPVYIKETFTYQIPVMIPVLGLKIGGIYFLSFLLSGFAKLFFVISFGKIRLKKNSHNKDSDNFSFKHFIQPVKRKFMNIVLSTFKSQTKLFLKVSSFFVSMTFIVFLLINIGFLNKVKNVVEPLTGIFKLPSESILPITTYIFNPLLGATSVSTLVKEGKLNDFQAIVTCMLGGFLMLPVFSFRSSLPKYTSIFGFNLGMSIILVSTFLGMFVRGIFLFAFLFMI